MTNLERLKAAMQTESTLAGIVKKAKVSVPMAQFHVKRELPKKRLIVVKD